MIPKFRVWNKKTQAFFDYGDAVLDLASGKIFAGDVGVMESTIDVTDQVELMQSTGLKDKNGVEIFEGDIVLENGMQRVITFGEQRYEEDFGNLAYYIGFNIFTKWGYSSIDPVEHEVLGNIYENPELLEGKE